MMSLPWIPWILLVQLTPDYLPLQLSPRFHSYNPSPMSPFHLLLSQPCYHTLNKGSLSPLYSPSNVPHSVSQSPDCSTSLVIPLMLLSRKHHCLVSCMSPYVDVNTSILEERPRDPCILVSSTSFMSSLDHLKGVISAFQVGCVSRARLQLHHCTVEIHTGYRFLHYLVKNPSCHLILAHWCVYLGPIQFHVRCGFWDALMTMFESPQCYASMYLQYLML